jgi:hypothetical protein
MPSWVRQDTSGSVHISTRLSEVVVIRIAYLLWMIVFLGLAIAALADTVFGTAPLGRRLDDFLPRVVVAFVWPLAVLTPRGRFLLWQRWRP